jgi:hypothetical protein
MEVCNGSWTQQYFTENLISNREVKIISKNGYMTQNYRVLSKITHTYTNYISTNQFDKINSKGKNIFRIQVELFTKQINIHEKILIF